MNINLNNLDPKHFDFWFPPADHVVSVGPDQTRVNVPNIPLPIKINNVSEDEPPSDNAIGEGLYDYLRQFPDCLNNQDYAEFLQKAYPHYLADMAAQVVMLDKKDVEPAYVLRKLTYLKVLRLLNPKNKDLLWQLCHGFYNLAMTFTELSNVRRYLLEVMRFGQDLEKIEPENVPVLSLLVQIDILFGDYPNAIRRLKHLLSFVNDDNKLQEYRDRLETCLETGLPGHCLVDDLEKIADAMQLYSAGKYSLATEILERLEMDKYFTHELKSADFLCLLGMCRLKTGDMAGAFEAATQALEMDPEHQQAQEVLEAI